MKRWIGAAVVTVAMNAFALPAYAQVGKVSVTGGEVQGVVAGGIASFKGIPFAAAPVGDNRWKAPRPVEPWSGVKKADAMGPACMQDPGMAQMVGAPLDVSEDCLYLNVWTPAKAAGDKLPVMVWIYGGAFAGGATNWPFYDGTRLAEKGVVLVSVAYRVGPFGFLAHPGLSKESGKGSGNYGLQDQIAGLKWVRDNIAKFGGDAGRVTLFGESAGGIAVSMLAASPQAKRLFHRAISESGGSFAPAQTESEAGQNVPTLKVAEASGQKFLAGLGANDVKAARALPAEKIQGALKGIGGFWPVLDGHVIVGDQYELYQAGKFNDTPVLIGTNSDEGNMFTPPAVKPAELERAIREGYGEKADVILAANPHGTDAQARTASKNVFRDSVFAWPTWAWANLQSQKAKNKAYVYYFDHRTPMSPEGANHAAEITFVFRNLANPMAQPTQEEIALSELMSSYWVNFAKSGDPNGAGLPQWPAFSHAAPKVMHFDKSPGARDGVPNLDQLEAFDAYFAWRREKAKGAK
jgi:para-nitrobenzyl esterase